MWPLIGIGVIVIGFTIRINPLIVIVTAALATGIAAHHSVLGIIAAFGKAYNDSRYVSIVWLILPVIGLLEREGLQERARTLVGRITAATAGRLLVVYLALRQLTAAFGLLSLFGHAQTVRPLIAPMAEGAAETKLGRLSHKSRMLIRAYAASADNVGAFFGEDIFLAVGSILLIKGVLQQMGILVTPVSLSMWAIPTALLAFVVHGARLWRLDARLRRQNDDEAR
ncbi:MAG: DUF969 domain-containing protein [Alphaproteobacteria bacterium]|nr:DUF969 domain-containing protein [Alphaproteobacteria bacterium]